MTPALRHLKTLFTCLVMAIGLDAAALQPNYYATSSALASGRWVKIRVNQTGIQEITADQLRSIGFNDPAKVAVHGFSVIDIASHALNSSLPDDLPTVPSILVGDKILFYGESGIRTKTQWNNGRILASYDQNQTSLSGCYFLHEEDNPARLDFTSSATPAGNTRLTTSFRIDQNINLEENSQNAGAYYLSHDITRTPDLAYTHTFHPSHQDTGMNPWYTITYVSAGSREPVTITLPDTSLTYTPYTNSPLSYTKNFTGAPLSDNQRDLTFKVKISSEYETFAVSNVAMIYRRQNYLDPGQDQTDLYFKERIGPGTCIAIENANPDNLEVWRIINNGTPVRLKITSGGTTEALAINATDIKSSEITRFLAFKPSGQLHPIEIIGDVPASDLHSMATPHMLIITTPFFQSEATRLASLHHDIQGLDVAIVNVDPIYNEFSSGTPSVDGIRRFVKMLYDRDPSRLKHLLLLGTATSNPRGIGDSYIGPRPLTDVPTFACEDLTNQFTESKCYANDAFLGKLTDSQGTIADKQIMSINVGRIPATDIAQASDYIGKVADYMTTPAATDLRSRAIVIGDRGDKSGHLLQCEELCRIITKAAPATLISKIYDAMYEYDDGQFPGRHRQLIADNLTDGVSFMTYAGHGNPMNIGGVQLWTTGEIVKNKHSHPPFVSLATCDALPFDRHVTGNFGEQMIFNRHGGAIALVAACRTVQMNSNHTFNKALVKEYFSLDSGSTSMGDVFRAAHNFIMTTGQSTAVTNTLSYNFGGDPAIPLHKYTHSITLDNNDITLSSLSADNLITGSVTDPHGSPDDSFNGSVIASLYTPGTTVKLLQHHSSDTAKTVNNIGYCVATARAAVKNGRFSTRFDLPVIGAPGDNYRLQLSALRDSSFDIASTCVAPVTVINNDDTSITPSDGPVIESFTIDDLTYHNGDILTGDIRFNAVVKPDQYAIATGLSISRTNYIDLDGTRHPLGRHTTIDNDGTAIISFTAPALDDGEHTATLSVTDCAENRSEASITFTTLKHNLDASLTADTNVAADQVTFSLNHSADNEPIGRLSITDQTGVTVFSVNPASFPFTWDLNDNNGNRVPDGRYTVSAWLRHERNFTEAKTITIHVIAD